MRRELRDVRTVASNIDHRTRNLTSPAAIPSSDALLSKALVCHALSGLRSKPGEPVAAAAVATELYKSNYAVVGALAQPGLIGKAASAAANTGVTGWAAELANQGVSDRGFLQLLAPNSVYAQLSQRPNSIRIDLSGYGSVRVPTRAPSPTIGGSFVAQGAPFPVRQALFNSIALTPKAMKVGSMITGEMLNYSLPNVEIVVRAIMAFDTAIAPRQRAARQQPGDRHSSGWDLERCRFRHRHRRRWASGFCRRRPRVGDGDRGHRADGRSLFDHEFNLGADDRYAQHERYRQPANHRLAERAGEAADHGGCCEFCLWGS